MANISPKNILTSESSEDSLNDLKTESEIGSFVGDKMSSGSASFIGFTLSNQSFDGKLEAPPNLLVNDNEDESKIKIDESKKGAITSVNQHIVFQGDLLKNVELTNDVAGVIPKSNKVNIGKDFKVDFNQVENMYTLFDTSPQFYDGDSRLVAPHSTPIPQFEYESNTLPKVAKQLPNKNKGLQTYGIQTPINNTNNIEGSDTTGSRQTATCEAHTDTMLDGQTGKLELVEMIRYLRQKDDNMLNILDTRLTQQENNITKQMSETQNNLDTRLTQQENYMHENKTEVLSAVESLATQITSVTTKLGECQKEIITLQSQNTAISLQVALNQDKGEENTQEILVLKEKTDRLQIRITEELENNKLQIKSNYKIINESISNMSINLQQSRHDLDDLKSKYFLLEGAIVQNREQGNHLNNRFVEITKNLISDVFKNPEHIESLLHQVALPTVNLNQGKTASPDAIPNKQTLPSISSSPLLSSGFFTPPIASNQLHPCQNIGAPFSTRLESEELIMKNIMKKEKTPSFDGNNISAPQFLEELEAYFNMVNIHNDANRMKAFGSFLQGVPNGWWKRISKNIFTWEEAKNALLTQYFNDYNRERFEQEWKDWDYNKVKNAEAFALRAFNLLDIVKPDLNFKKKCQNIASKLPSPIRNYLLQKDFRDERDFMVVLKEAMTLTNFRENTSTAKTNGSVSSNHSYNFHNLGRNFNNNNNPHNNNHNPEQTITNPNYKGKPVNFNPNYKKPDSPYNHNNGQNSDNNSRRWTEGGRPWNSHNGNGNNGGRRWTNNNVSNPTQPPYHRSNWSSGNRNNQPVRTTSVSNVAVGPATNPNMTPMTTPKSSVSSAPRVVIHQETANAMSALCEQFMSWVSHNVSSPISTSEQEQESLISSNI